MDYFDRPEQEDIDFLIHEIQLYDPNFSAYNTRTWDNHQQLVQTLYQAQYNFVNRKDVCYVGQGKVLFEKAQQALAFRDDLYKLTNSTLAYLSPEGIYFPNEAIYKATKFAYEAYLEKGGKLGFEDWYYETFFKVLPSTVHLNRGNLNFQLEQGTAASGWKHIYDRHIDPTRFPNKSKFDKSLSQQDILVLLAQTIRHGTKTTYEGLDVYTFRTNFSNTGYKDYRVTINTDGTIRTFHPLD